MLFFSAAVPGSFFLAGKAIKKAAISDPALYGSVSSVIVYQQVLTIILSLLLVSCLIMAELYVFRTLRDYSRCIHEQ